MPLHVYDPRGTEATTLALVEEGPYVYVCVVTPDGTPRPGGKLVGFSPDGSMFFPSGVDPAFGFPLTGNGSLQHTITGSRR